MAMVIKTVKNPLVAILVLVKPLESNDKGVIRLNSYISLPALYHVKKRIDITSVLVTLRCWRDFRIEQKQLDFHLSKVSCWLRITNRDSKLSWDIERKGSLSICYIYTSSVRHSVLVYANVDNNPLLFATDEYRWQNVLGLSGRGPRM